MSAPFDPESAAVLSPAEEAFERGRRRAGLLLAPVVLAVLWWLPVPALSGEAHRLLAVMGAVVVLWMSEALPMGATALLGPALCVVAGVAPARDAYRSFADPIIFLFLGSFMLVEAMLKHGLNRRIAFHILGLRWIAARPFRLYAAYGSIAIGLSMWVSNAATTAMMLPIGI
ncbi:MAG: SLC13 family permease, partial [Verrucomicrobiota bacterium]